MSLMHKSPAYLDEEYPIVISIINDDYRTLDVVLDVLLQPTDIDEAGTSYQQIRLHTDRISPLKSERHPR
jgi:trafficking protein particle complex subunit 11